MYFTCPRGLTWADHGMGGHGLWLGLTSGGCGEEVIEEERGLVCLLVSFLVTSSQADDVAD